MVVGGNFAVRRAALEAIDGFGYDDYVLRRRCRDLARRLHAVGKCGFHPSFCNYTSARRPKKGFCALWRHLCSQLSGGSSTQTAYYQESYRYSMSLGAAIVDF